VASKGGNQVIAVQNNSVMSRNAWLVVSYLFLNSIPIGYMNVVPLIYLIQIGYSPATVSIIYAASAISNTIGLTPFGILADRFGRKKFLIIGSVVPAASYIIFGLTLDPFWLIVASIVGGVGLAGGLAVAISGPSLLPIVADTASMENRTRIFGIVQAVWNVALTVGSVMSGLPDIFQAQFGFGDIFAHSVSYFLMAGLIVVSIVPLIFVRERAIPIRARSENTSDRASEKPQKHRTVFGFVSGREIKRFSVVYALSGLGLGVIVQLLASWFNLRFGTSESVAGNWIGLAELVSASSILFIPFLVRRRGTLQTTVVTSLISAAFLLAMPFSGAFQIAAILFVVRSVFTNISWPILQSYVMGVIDERERAAATGIATTAWGISNSIGTLVGGVLLSAGLLSIPFVIGFVGYAGSALALGYLFRGIKPPEEHSKVLDKIE
jgi:MFS family permease